MGEIVLLIYSANLKDVKMEYAREELRVNHAQIMVIVQQICTVFKIHHIHIFHSANHFFLLMNLV